jgi:rRNA maturation RNase YbeY
MTTDTPLAGLPLRVMTVANRQRACSIHGGCLRRLIRFHLEEQLQLTRYDLAIHLLGITRMAEANAVHLKHEGATDVITFNYADPGTDVLHGELLVCPAVALEQAQAYRTSWESELMRYIVHGVLHLRGYDDQTPADRRTMRREENRLVSALEANHPLHLLGSPGRSSRKRSLESAPPPY